MRFCYFLKKKRFYFAIILLVILIRFTNCYFDEAIFQYVEIKSRSYFERMVNESIKTSAIEVLDGKIMNQVLDENNNVVYAYMDVHKALKIKSNASDSLTKMCEDLKENKDLQSVEVPFGYFITKSVMMSDGLRLPVDLTIYEAPQTEIRTEVFEYGINSSMEEVLLDLKMYVHLQIPFQSKRVELASSVLISAEIINSKVPNYYFDTSK